MVDKKKEFMWRNIFLLFIFDETSIDINALIYKVRCFSLPLSMSLINCYFLYFIFEILSVSLVVNLHILLKFE